MVALSRKETVWELAGISLEDYAKAFNAALEVEWDKAVGNDIYLVSFVGEKLQVNKIINTRAE
jgi:hypothetical protein